MSRSWSVGRARRPGPERAWGRPVRIPRSVRDPGSWVGGSLSLPEHRIRWPVEFGSSYHTPVMVAEVLHYLRPERGGLFLDGTLGGGGHAEAILSASEHSRVVGIDRDPEALATASARLARFGERFRAVPANFGTGVYAAGIAPGTLSGALLDLGISSHQIDEIGRGFTFRPGAPLDMRMEGAEGGPSAADLLNELEEEELADLFYRFGEERRSRRLAREVVAQRARSAFRTSDELVSVIERALPRSTIQDRARIFQALRIAVNRELEEIASALPALRDALVPGGVLVVLSYHSLEDRIIKDRFREWSRRCICPPGLPVCVCRGSALGESLTRKPIMAGPAEVEANPRARSARLRAWAKS